MTGRNDQKVILEKKWWNIIVLSEVNKYTLCKWHMSKCKKWMWWHLFYGEQHCQGGISEFPEYRGHAGKTEKDLKSERMSSLSLFNQGISCLVQIRKKMAKKEGNHCWQESITTETIYWGYYKRESSHQDKDTLCTENRCDYFHHGVPLQSESSKINSVSYAPRTIAKVKNGSIWN